MNKKEIAYTPVYKLIELIKSQKITSEEITEILIERIREVNPKLNAYCTPTFDLARKMAINADKRVKKGQDTGILNGIPVSIKDLNAVAGVRMTMGSKIYEDYVPKKDCECVKRLRDEGCVFLGKTNTPEFGLKGVCDNLVFGATKNPWDLTKTPGGSSGGAGAAVAAGISPLAQGSDGGGSIRHPSSFCGVFGIKPSFGRVPIHPRKFIMAQTLSVIGPLTRYVKDAALMLDAMKGNYTGDRFSLPDDNILYSEHIDNTTENLKIGYLTRFRYTKIIDSEVEKTVIDSVNLFEQFGWEVEKIKMRLTNPELTFFRLWNTKVAYDLKPKLKKWRDKMDPTIISLIESGLNIPTLDVMKAYDNRNKLYKKFFKKFKKYDVIVTPTTAIPAFEINKVFPSKMNGKKVKSYTEDMEINSEDDYKVVSPLAWQPFTFPINMVGLPAASIPCGFTSSGLPIGMQIIGNKYEELKVLQVSKVFEDLKPWHDQQPKIN